MEESSVADQPSSTDAKAPSVIKRPKPARLSSDEEDIHDDYLEDTDKKTQSEKIEAVPVSVSQRFFFTPSDPRLASDTIGMYNPIFNASWYPQQCNFVPGKSVKRPGIENMLHPEYRSKDIENCLALFLIYPVRFSNAPGFNRPFVPFEIGDFLQKAPFEAKQKARFPFVLFLSNNET